MDTAQNKGRISRELMVDICISFIIYFNILFSVSNICIRMIVLLFVSLWAQQIKTFQDMRMVVMKMMMMMTTTMLSFGISCVHSHTRITKCFQSTCQCHLPGMPPPVIKFLNLVHTFIPDTSNQPTSQPSIHPCTLWRESVCLRICSICM